MSDEVDGRSRATRAGGLTRPVGAVGRLGAACLPIAMAMAWLGCWDVEERKMLVARTSYDRYCGECHGTSDGGPEPVAGLGFQPTDLRRLGEEYGTPLDREALTDYIDGRHALRDGEERIMPVWGDRLYDHLPDTVEVDEIRTGTIGLLIDYLQSIQQEG